jgi:hypothetical protein
MCHRLATIGNTALDLVGTDRTYIIPGLPVAELDPAFVMLLFLPPLLYAAGVSMSWRGFLRALCDNESPRPDLS